MRHHQLTWAWPTLDLPTFSGPFPVRGLVVPYSTLCWLDRDGGAAGWQALNPTPAAPLPAAEALFRTADVILATGRAWEEIEPGDLLGLDPFVVTETPLDDVLVFGRRAYEGLVFGRAARPENLKVLVVPLDLETDELFRLASWVEWLRGRQDAFDGPGPVRVYVPAPWKWDAHAGAKE